MTPLSSRSNYNTNAKSQIECSFTPQEMEEIEKQWTKLDLTPAELQEAAKLKEAREQRDARISNIYTAAVFTFAYNYGRGWFFVGTANAFIGPVLNLADYITRHRYGQ